MKHFRIGVPIAALALAFAQQPLANPTEFSSQALSAGETVIGPLAIEAVSALAPALQATVTAAELDPAQAALQAAVIAEFGVGSAVEAFYAATGYQPLWLAEGAEARLDALLATLEDAGSHALPVARYQGSALREAVAGLREDARLEAVAHLEVALTLAYLTYARDVSSGLLEPRQVSRELKVNPPRPEQLDLLTDVALAGDFPAHLASLPPQSPEYVTLRARYQGFTAEEWAAPVPKGRSLRPGQSSDRIPALRNRLAALGDYVSGPVEEGTERLYDPGLEAAVRRFQGRHGLNVDGIVGPATLAAINTAPEFRAAQIAVNMERIRWLNRELGDRHVYVNLADFMVYLVEDGRPVFESRVVIGKARDHRTPEFSDEMEHIVVNPRWYVPRSIAQEEILPRLANDPTYLERRNMRIINGTIVQGPGPSNALGRVKFIFPNDDAIYLHDTPAKSLFRRDVRAYSHGCVRVEKPYDFAYALLAPQEADPEAAFKRWLRTGNERFVKLQRFVPVHITYRTAWVDAAGVDQFRQDVYGRDKLVAEALREAGVTLPEL